MYFLGMNRAALAPSATEIAFIMFMAIVAKSHSTKGFIRLTKSITIMKVLSPISPTKTRANDYHRPTINASCSLITGTVVSAVIVEFDIVVAFIIFKTSF